MTYQPRVQYVAKRHERMAADTVMRLLAVLDARTTARDERIRGGLRLAAEHIYAAADVVLPKFAGKLPDITK